jgi:hypothetical protein
LAVLTNPVFKALTEANPDLTAAAKTGIDS